MLKTSQRTALNCSLKNRFEIVQAEAVVAQVEEYQTQDLQDPSLNPGFLRLLTITNLTEI